MTDSINLDFDDGILLEEQCPLALKLLCEAWLFVNNQEEGKQLSGISIHAPQDITQWQHPFYELLLENPDLQSGFKQLAIRARSVLHADPASGNEFALAVSNYLSLFSRNCG